MKVLVTGADGFLGRHVLQELSNRGHTSVGLSGPGAAEGLRVDIVFQPDELLDILRSGRPEAVVHLAAQSSVAQSWVKPQETLAANVEGTINVWQCASAVRARRFIAMSSAEIYQSQPARLSETAPAGPRNPYGLSKWTMEQMLRMLRRAESPQLYGMRLFNLVGPGQRLGFVVPDLASQIAESMGGGSGGGALKVGDVRPVRDFLDVRDAARAIAMAVEGQLPPDTYNVCSGIPRSIGSLLQDLCRLGSHPGITKTVQDPSRLRPLEVPTLIGSYRRLESYGWSPLIPWHTTLTDVLAEWTDKLWSGQSTAQSS